MRRTILIATSVSMLATGAFAQNASSKATAQINTLVGCTVKGTSTLGDTIPVTCKDVLTGSDVVVDADNFATIMSSTIKVSNSQSLFVSPSLVTGLYTQTKVQSKTGGPESVAVAAGGVFLRAIVTNTATGVSTVGYPVKACTTDIFGCYQDKSGKFGVTLDSRVQTLSQSISDCLVNVTVGGVAGSGTCTFDVTTNLALKTTSAHTFNFIFPNIGVGTYKVDIQAAVNADATVTNLGTAIGAAAYGLGSLTVESVRLVHDFSF